MTTFGRPLGLEAIVFPTAEDFARTLRAGTELRGPFVRKIGFTVEL